MNAKFGPFFSIILTVFVMFVKISTSSAQDSFPLVSDVTVGSESEVIVQMDVKGSLQVLENAQPVDIPLTVKADLRYRELRQAPNGGTLNALRKYSKSDATITVDGNPIEPVLRDTRRRVRVESGAKLELYSVDGPLTREELDLLDVQGNTVLLDGLVPEKVVTVGDSWSHHDAMMASLLSIDAVSVNEVQSTLVSADDASATVELSGRVEGAVHGVSTEIEVGGKYLFDRQAGRVTKCQLILKEKRSIGHVGPGINAESTINILVTPQTDKQMGNLISLGAVAAANRFVDLECIAESGFSFNYDRRWHVMDESPGQISLRMVDRGDLIAQAKISLIQSSAGAIAATDFRRQITQALGDKAKEVTSQGSLKTKAGQRVSGLTATGIVSGLPIQWRYYLIGEKAGQQVAIVITLEPELATKLGGADRGMVESLKWTQGSATASAPTPAVR